MNNKRSYLSLDWEFKQVLRDKSDFRVMEGLFTVLLGRKVKVAELLESESNQDNVNGKYNKVDMLAKDEGGELFIVELQYDTQYDFFQRILFGTSKLITQFINKGEPYSRIKKVYSISIVYFSLGVGTDYIYKGTTEFRGMNDNDVLQMSDKQIQYLRQNEPYPLDKAKKTIGEIFPEYYLIRVNNFNKPAPETPLEEWIYFLKTDEIRQDSKVPGLPEAREKLRYELLDEREKKEYDTHMEQRRYALSINDSAFFEGEISGLEKGEKLGLEKGEKLGLEKGEKLGMLKSARALRDSGMPLEQIIRILGLSPDDIAEL